MHAPELARAGWLAHVSPGQAVPNPVGTDLRVALVNPPDASAGAERRALPPLGLGYVAAVARAHGFWTDIIDFVAERDISLDLVRRAGLDTYDVIGIGTYTATFGDSVAVARAVKMAQPRARVVMGGYHATAAASAILADHPEVDAVVRREGEDSFVALLQRWSRGESVHDVPGVVSRVGSGIRETCVAEGLIDQERLPLPVIDTKFGPRQYATFFDQRRGRDRGILAVVSSRGCPKRCSFCSIIVLSPKWRARDVSSLMSEIEQRSKDRRFGHILFQDANFFVNPRRTLEFARALNAFDASLTWSGTATADQICQHESVLREIGRMNCAYLEVGIESGNVESLRRFNKKTTVEQNRRAIALLRMHGIAMGLDFIMFDPDMTFADLEQNVAFLFESEFFGYWPPDPLTSELQLYPDTPMRSSWQERLHTSFAPHSMPRAPFVESEVDAVRRSIQGYEDRFGCTTRGWIERLETAVRNAHRVPHESEHAELVQRARACVVRLKHLQYQQLLDAIAARGSAVPFLCVDPQDESLARERRVWSDAERLHGSLVTCGLADTAVLRAHAPSLSDPP